MQRVLTLSSLICAAFGMLTACRVGSQFICSRGSLRNFTLGSLSKPYRSFSAMSATDAKADEVNRYWLGENYKSAPATYDAIEKQPVWFRGGAAIDAEVTEKFGPLVESAASGGLDPWINSDDVYNTLAALIVMDQFTRNIYRGSPKAFALDPVSSALAMRMVAEGRHKKLKPIERMFVALPLMHMESLEGQDLCIKVLQEAADEAKPLPNSEGVVKMLINSKDYGSAHRAVIEKFGRFPHRNAILGRPNTAEETEGFEKGTIAKF